MHPSRYVNACEHIWRSIETRQNELLGLCASCVRIPAPNPPGETEAIADFVSGQLIEIGVPVEVFEPRPRLPTVIGTIGNRAAGSPHLVVNCHLDTFPPAAGLWTHGDPYSGVIDQGRLYGCGASDMRASVGVTLFLASLLKTNADDLSGRVTLAFVSDEESGGRWGTEWLLDNVASVRGDACLIGDQCGPELVGVAEKGFCRVTVTTKGTMSHAAYGTDDSATHRLLRVLTAIRGLEDISPPSGMPATLANRVTVNIGVLRGGVAMNLVADTAAANIDIRIPPWFSSEELLNALNDVLAETGEEHELHVDQIAEPSETPLSSELVRTVLDAVTRATGRAAEPCTRIGASDARFFRSRGIPTVVYGPRPNNMGSIDEFVTCSEILTTARVHAAVMLAFLEAV
jgi:succinyl-diaminopimelate desuccinylase